MQFTPITKSGTNIKFDNMTSTCSTELKSSSPQGIKTDNDFHQETLQYIKKEDNQTGQATLITDPPSTSSATLSEKRLRIKSRIQQTKHLSTNADSSIDTTVGWTKNTQKPDFFKKWKKNQKLKNVQ